MLLLSAIDHIVLRVTSLDSMARFYCDVLGCIREREVEELGLVQLRAGGSLIDLVAVHGGRHHDLRVLPALPDCLRL